MIADGAIEAPPTVADDVVGDLHAPRLLRARRGPSCGPGAWCWCNTTVFEGSFDPVELLSVVEVPATDLAVDLGNIMTASMVMLGAYVAATGMVGARRARRRGRRVAAVVPDASTWRATSPRIRAGFEAAPRDLAPAWHGGRVRDGESST